MKVQLVDKDKQVISEIDLGEEMDILFPVTVFSNGIQQLVTCTLRGVAEHALPEYWKLKEIYRGVLS